MVCGPSRNNHLLDSFLGRRLAGTITVRIVNVALMLVLVNVGNLRTWPLGCVPPGQGAGAQASGSSHPEHTACGVPVTSDTHLGRQGRREGTHVALQRRQC